MKSEINTPFKTLFDYNNHHQCDDCNGDSYGWFIALDFEYDEKNYVCHEMPKDEVSYYWCMSSPRMDSVDLLCNSTGEVQSIMQCSPPSSPTTTEKMNYLIQQDDDMMMEWMKTREILDTIFQALHRVGL